MMLFLIVITAPPPPVAPALLLEMLREKTQGANLPRLSELHRVCLNVKSPADKEALFSTLDLFLSKKMNFTTETATLFIKAATRAGAFMYVYGSVFPWRCGYTAANGLPSSNVSLFVIRPKQLT